jgi:hypothetical protein
LKRVTPSFTVEYRQAKRPNTGSTKLGWAHARPAPEVAEKGSRVAISAFKTPLPADVISPSIPRGRILPSLVEAARGTGQADAERAQSRSQGSAAKAGHATQVTGDETVAGRLGENIYSAEGLEPLVAVVATNPRLESPTPSDPSATKAGTPRSEKRTRRPAEKRAQFDRASTSADMFKTPPMSSTSGLPPIDKPSSTSRTSRILDRYVFRDERLPGESWKRRIEARRERRAQAPASLTEPIGSE